MDLPEAAGGGGGGAAQSAAGWGRGRRGGGRGRAGRWWGGGGGGGGGGATEQRKGRRRLLLIPLVNLSVVKILLAAGTTLVFATAAVRGQRSEVSHITTQNHKTICLINDDDEKTEHGEM